MTHPPGQGALAVSLSGLELQNPVLLAAGTAGFGREVAEVMDLERLGGLVTKSVSLAPRAGAPAPRVAEYPGGMLNAVGLANPGVEAVRRDVLPWLAANLLRARALVSVVGDSIEDFAAVVDKLDDSEAIAAYELNLSCPNVKAGGLEFGADRSALREVVRLARSATRRPIFVKLSPAHPELVAAATAALESGADGLTLLNTMPGMLVDTVRRRPVLGFGTGGASGPGLLPIGVLAVARVYRATAAPVIGVGGISSLGDALQYIMAGAAAIAVGTAALRDPRFPERLVSDLAAWCEVRGEVLRNLRGVLEWGA